MLNDELEIVMQDSNELKILKNKLNEFFEGSNLKRNSINLNDLESKDTIFWKDLDQIKIDMYKCKNESTMRILNS
jgi:hypothetical protein